MATETLTVGARHDDRGSRNSSPAASSFPAPRFVWLARIAPRLWTEWSMWRINRWIRTLSDAELAQTIRETRAYLADRDARSTPSVAR